MASRRAYPGPRNTVRFRPRAILAAFAIAILIITVTVFAAPQFLTSHSVRAQEPTLSASSATGSASLIPALTDIPILQRPIYRYSVIPGGVDGAAELENSIKADRLVAAHYADFVLGKARMITLAADMKAFVSYRRDGRIYWTSHRVNLRKGERILSDGVHMARGRCGNRISMEPQTPVSPAEPNPLTFDDPEIPLVPDPLPSTTASEIPEWPPLPLDPTQSGLIPTPIPIPTPESNPPLILPFPIGGPPFGPPWVPIPIGNPNPAPPVPEPGTLLMLGSGIALAWNASRRVRRRK